MIYGALVLICPEFVILVCQHPIFSLLSRHIPHDFLLRHFIVHYLAEYIVPQPAIQEVRLDSRTEVERLASGRAEEHHIEECVVLVTTDFLSLELLFPCNSPLLIVCLDSVVEYTAAAEGMLKSRPDSTRCVALEVPSKIHGEYPIVPYGLLQIRPKFGSEYVLRHTTAGETVMDNIVIFFRCLSEVGEERVGGDGLLVHPPSRVSEVDSVRRREAKVFASVFVDRWINLDDGRFDPMRDQGLRGDARSKAAEWWAVSPMSRVCRA
jgi:hypothetical protein